MIYTVVDIETDGLLETVSKIHCLSYKKMEDGRELRRGTIVHPNRMIKFLQEQNIIVGHNITKYDIPVLEKLLQIKIKARLIDTLGLSWYLYPTRIKHGLEGWGEELGVPKPPILDWVNLTLSEYVHRCESDVEINSLLFTKQFLLLLELYVGELEPINNLINYLSFKLACSREQEEVQCKLDLPLINKSLLELEVIREEKIHALQHAMPRDIKYKRVSPPVKLVKADGTPTVRANVWADLLYQHNLPANYAEDLMIVNSNELGNPDSSKQIKDWLTSLGWIPITFEHRANKAGIVKAIPQIYGEDGVCDSIKILYDIEPALEHLDMLTLVNHRIGIFEAYLDTMNTSGYIIARTHGFTNTLRFKHKKPIANLPKIFKFYGEQIRGAIIAPTEHHTLCGADMTSLEDTTKQHYMFMYDPKYVEQMRVPGFDPHIDIGVLARMLTKEEETFFKWFNETKKKDKDYSFTSEELSRYAHISHVRGKAKVVNFSGIYGAGPAKIAIAAGISQPEAFALHKTYWQRNKAVKLVEKACLIKTIYSTKTIERKVYAFDIETEQFFIATEGEEFIEEQMWLFNPVSGFWYSLRYMKDRFSTLNQGTGVYCFDMWVREVRAKGLKIMLQYHDEIVLFLSLDYQAKVKKILEEAIVTVNKKLSLNVPLGVDVQFGANYAEIH